jgi:YVTN family beta-propeller protein
MKTFAPIFACLLSLACVSVPAQPIRQPSEDVDSAQVRQRQGLAPDKNLLFNGWGVTPAGEHVVVSDLPLRLVVAPDQKRLVAVHGGYNKHGVTVIDATTRQQTQFVPLDETWNGLAFSQDGSRFYVTGGDSGLIHVFSYEAGTATLKNSTAPSPGAASTFLAGLAVHPQTGKLFVCNEGNEEVWRVNPETLVQEGAVAVGDHPHSCLFGADKRHLYVSNWGSRTVSVIDTERWRKVRDIEVGRRPNEMALSPDGRLFVACAGDNTVHVIQTRALEKARVGADATRRLDETTREIIATSLYPDAP